MQRRVGGWTLRYAQGPGRQSGILLLSAVAIALLPFTALMRPDCGGNLLGCASSWDAVLLVPRILFLPAAVAAILLAGTWWAQWRHAPVEKRYFAQLATSSRVERPPGHFDATPLEQDLIKRTLRGLAAAGLVATGAIGSLAFTTLALRSCDPWTMRGTGLAPCDSTAGWTDLVVAFEIWGLLALLALSTLVWFTRSTSVRVDLPKRRRRLPFRRRVQAETPRRGRAAGRA